MAVVVGGPAATAAAQDTETDAPSSAPLPSDLADAPDEQPADQPPVATGPWGVPPVQLMIPSLGVEAVVEAVGQDPDGAMSTPTQPDDVAWYELGMGVPGNVVVAAHVNWGGRLRAFGELHLLEVGDIIQVIDAEGHGYEYAVESSHWVRAEGAPLDEIFAQPPVMMMTLITCGGEYVPSRREYLDRLIVRARGA
jgi:sortase (surface protein transpeptidase)